MPAERLWMLHGTKKVVVVSPSSTRSLYERPEFGGAADGKVKAVRLVVAR